MKRKFIPLLVTLALTISVAAPIHAQKRDARSKPAASDSLREINRYKMVCKNLGPNGYAMMRSTSRAPLDGPRNNLIVYYGAGASPIRLASDSDEPTRNRTEQHRLLEYAYGQIQAGRLTGAHTIVVEDRRVVVTWHATDRYNLTIEELHYVK